MNNKRHISIIGGSGHVGFPLGLIFSSKGFKVSLIDRHKVNNEKINSGQTPFLEENSHKLLKDMIRKKRIHATSQLNEVRRSKYIIVCIGTPITRKLNPSLKNFSKEVINLLTSNSQNINLNAEINFDNPELSKIKENIKTIAPIKSIVDENTSKNSMVFLFKEVVDELKNIDFQESIRELEVKFEKNMDNATFQEIVNLKSKVKGN